MLSHRSSLSVPSFEEYAFVHFCAVHGGKHGSQSVGRSTGAFLPMVRDVIWGGEDVEYEGGSGEE